MHQAAELVFNSTLEGKIRAKKFNQIGENILKNADLAPNPQKKKIEKSQGFSCTNSLWYCFQPNCL